MFVSSVANIPPGGTVTISIAYLESLPYRDGRYTLSLPLTITPRYTPGMQRRTPRRVPRDAGTRELRHAEGRHRGGTRSRVCAGGRAEPLPRHPHEHDRAR